MTLRSQKTFKFNLANSMMFLALMTFPFYIMPSGAPQISSFFIILLIIFSLIKSNSYFLNIFNRNSLFLQLFLIYVVIVSITWSLLVKDINILKAPFFYIFNYFLFFSFSYILSTYDKCFYSLPKFITLSALTQVILSLSMSNNWGDRSTVFFNNPNQLGYYSLLSASILVIYYKNNLTGSLWFYIGIASSLWLAQLSLSSATILSILMLIAYSTFSSIRNFLYFILLACLVFIFFLYYQEINLERLITVYSNINNIGNSGDDSFSGRGYDRILNHPYILSIGGGEGAVYRWDSVLSQSEMHSTFGTILFSYGIVGFSLFMLFLRKIVFSGGMTTFIPFFTLVLYGVTHNGLRFPLFWLFLSICLTLKMRTEN